MGLLEEIEAQGPRKGPACAMSVIEAGLKPADLAELRAAFADASITSTAIARALKARGHHVGEGGVRKHRKHDCQCAA